MYVNMSENHYNLTRKKTTAKWVKTRCFPGQFAKYFEYIEPQNTINGKYFNIILHTSALAVVAEDLCVNINRSAPLEKVYIFKKRETVCLRDSINSP